MVMVGTMIDVQSFSKEVRVGSSLQCMLGRDCDIGIFQSLMLVGRQMMLMEVGKENTHEYRSEYLEEN